MKLAHVWHSGEAWEGGAGRRREVWLPEGGGETDSGGMGVIGPRTGKVDGGRRGCSGSSSVFADLFSCPSGGGGGVVKKNL